MTVMILMLLVIYMLSSVGSTSFSKATSKVVSGASRAKYSLFLIVNGLTACFFFWIFGGFKLDVNLPTLIYSAIYALIVALILILTMIAYRMVSVSGVNIIKSGCGLLGTSAIGFILFSEELSLNSLIRIAVMTVAIVFTFIDAKRNEGGEESRVSEKKDAGVTLKLAIVLALIAIVCCANTVTLKYYTLEERVADENSLFFFTNLIISIGCGAVLLFDAIVKKGKSNDTGDIFKLRALLPIVGNTLCSNVGSLVGILLLAQMQVSVYTPVISALGIVAGVIGSLIFRERLGVFSYLAAAAAIIAVII